MTSPVTYKVLRAFRVPKDGGIRVVMNPKPFRFYEVGATITAADVAQWGTLESVADLTATNKIVEIVPTAPAPSAPLVLPVSPLAAVKAALATATAAEAKAEAAVTPTPAAPAAPEK